MPYFLQGIEKVGYIYREHNEGDLSVDGIKAYCEAHPLVSSQNNQVQDVDKMSKKQINELVKQLLG